MNFKTSKHQYVPSLSSGLEKTLLESFWQPVALSLGYFGMHLDRYGYQIFQLNFNLLFIYGQEK